MIHIAFIVAYALTVATANRFRGGGLFDLPGEIPTDRYTQLRRLPYVLLMGVMTWNPFIAVIAYASLLTGWGFPISAAIRKNLAIYETEFAPFDKAAGWIVRRIYKQYRPHPYGVVWLSLHGLTFGALASAATQSFWPLLWVLMGYCYSLTKSWERGEIVYGALQGATLYLAIS